MPHALSSPFPLPAAAPLSSTVTPLDLPVEVILMRITQLCAACPMPSNGVRFGASIMRGPMYWHRLPVIGPQHRSQPGTTPAVDSCFISLLTSSDSYSSSTSFPSSTPLYAAAHHQERQPAGKHVPPPETQGGFFLCSSRPLPLPPAFLSQVTGPKGHARIEIVACMCGRIVDLATTASLVLIASILPTVRLLSLDLHNLHLTNVQADKDQRAALYDCIRGHIVTLRGCKTSSKVISLFDRMRAYYGY
ncbi:hypothetical protein B0H13DRAFT_2300646 [Mycena leptocephala]|nr:hypothetical protein B0H13DRAFT_2300646 [Mycena leptocephala]